MMCHKHIHFNLMKAFLGFYFVCHYSGVPGLRVTVMGRTGQINSEEAGEERKAALLWNKLTSRSSSAWYTVYRPLGLKVYKVGDNNLVQRCLNEL